MNRKEDHECVGGPKWCIEWYSNKGKPGGEVPV